MPVVRPPTHYNKWDIAGCNCATVQVNGCAGKAMEGATVNVYASDGGTLLFSGTTNSDGQVATGVDPGTYWVTITGISYRWESYAQSIALGSGITVITLSPASGYACCALCALPLSTTLSCSDSSFGGCTLTYNSGSGEWVGSITATSRGCNDCAENAVTLNYFLRCTSGGEIGLTWLSEYPSFCPGNIYGFTGANFGVGISSLSCPESFSASGSATPVTFAYVLYCTSSAVTLSVSE